MPTFRSLILHLAIAAFATLMVAAAAVAIGLSGAHSIGGQLESSDAVRVAGDWPSDLLAPAHGPARHSRTARSSID